MSGEQTPASEERIEQASEELSDAITERSEEINDAVEEAADQVTEEAEEAAEEIEEATEEAAEQVAEKVGITREEAEAMIEERLNARLAPPAESAGPVVTETTTVVEPAPEPVEETPGPDTAPDVRQGSFAARFLAPRNRRGS